MRLLCILCFVGLFGWGNGQLPVFEGTSRAPAGMLYYDMDKARDQRPRQYVYHIAPDSATCLQLDFSLVRSPGNRDFVKVWDPGQGDALLAELGGQHQSQLVQVEHGVVKVEFVRDKYALPSVWTLRWKSGRGSECLQGGDRLMDCPEIQEICGPEFVEDFRYYNDLQVESGSGYAASQAWYRFVAGRDGDLSFRLHPRNAFEDLDWELFRLPADSAEACPDDLSDGYLVASNHAAGQGPRGTTGMEQDGSGLRNPATGNPFARHLPARKGDQFYLHVLPQSSSNDGFRISFNEVVLDCTNPDRDFLPVGHQPPRTKSKVPRRNQFSRYTRVLRMDLTEKANRPLALCQARLMDLNAGECPKRIEGAWREAGSGLPGILLTGLKYGRFPAYSAHNHATPVSYGDLVQLVGKWEGETVGWEGSEDAFAPLANVLEIIVDETFDRNSGRQVQHLRMFRLVWSPEDPNLPDVNVAVVHYDDAAPYLRTVEIANPHNEATQMTIDAFLRSQSYNSVTVMQKDKPHRTAEEGAFEDARVLENQNFRWDY